MDRKILFSGLLVLLVALMFGCTQTSICGDTICQVGEENTCPTDCAKTINSNIIVNVNGAYNSQGKLWLEYYTNNNVYTNLSNTVGSVLGDHWQGSTSNNLSISFNQNNFVQKPVPQYGDRQIVISNVKQGEYVFTARSDDYGYFGTSEKVLVSEDKNYYVNVELKPSQPLLRVRAVDESWNKLVGPGTIAIYEVTNYLDKYGAGDWKTDEREVSSASFDSASEMNALFYLWAPKNELDSSSHFKVVLSKDNYGKSVQEYVWVGDKYQDQSFQIIKEKPKTGNLKVTVVPGVGTTLADLNVLIGKKVGIVPVSGTEEQYTEIISPDLTVTLSNYPYGQYNLWFYNTYDNQVPPVTIEYSIVTVDSDAGYAKVNGLLGSLLKLSITDSALKLLDTNLVSVYQICGYDQDNNYCSDYNGKSWVAVSGGASNPYTIPLQLSSEADLNRYSQMKYSFELGYAEMKKTFVFPYFKQGVNSVFLTFDPTPEVAAKAAWKVAQPWAITDWKRDANGLSVVLKNNTTETLIYSDMSINSTQKNTASGKVLAGATVVKNFPMTKCGSGMIYTYSKSGIVITYSTTAITGKKMSGVADIVVTCA